MTKTIAQRARYYMLDKMYGTEAENAYMQGATEQHKIDIDKACEIYHNKLQEIVNVLNSIGGMNCIEALGDILSIDESVQDFRKAMEEEL